MSEITSKSQCYSSYGKYEDIIKRLDEMPIPESRQKIQETTDYKTTSTYLRFHGSTYRSEVRYEKSPQFNEILRKEGYFMSGVQKAQVTRNGSAFINGPHCVVAKDGETLDIPKYYSNQKIDYEKYQQSLSH
ncbi:hypothetical protein CYY_007469 [Polysphondylium violaceum]|uniref:Uncharacterized protein n=1 Tax=Polysphondylium violaceum TaxID=133409 RepID=A0A8J4PNN8_9MYCE|nr:hypothetical protein CYY_007469 [Polysphondylium violaceum]